MTGPTCLFHYCILSQERSKHGHKEPLLPETPQILRKTDPGTYSSDYPKTIKTNPFFYTSLLKPFSRSGFPGITGPSCSLSDIPFTFFLHPVHAGNGHSFKFIYLFIFGCVGSSLLHTGFLQLRRAGGYSSLQRGLLIVVASLVADHGL